MLPCKSSGRHTSQKIYTITYISTFTLNKKIIMINLYSLKYKQQLLIGRLKHFQYQMQDLKTSITCTQNETLKTHGDVDSFWKEFYF
mgnify:CR=1 FL=1